MNILDDLPARDLILVVRAGAHAAPDYELPASAQFRDGVSDLDVARLILRIERGAAVVAGSSGRSWHTVPRGFRMPPLTRVVNEALRVRLVRLDAVRTGPHTVRQQLACAPVHVRDFTRTGRRRTACAAWLSEPFVRYRTVDDPGLADCIACKRTGQAY
jgi:hypothetical protein